MYVSLYSNINKVETMIERFLTQTHFVSEADYNEHLHFKIPEDFNFAYDVIDVWA